MKTLLFVLLLVTSNAYADWQNEYINEAPILAAGFLVSRHAEEKTTSWAVMAQMADWAQTLQISEHPNLVETNPILGKHPTRATVNTYFLSKIALTLWLDNRTFNMVQIGVSAAAIHNNYSLGLEVRF